MPGRSEITAYLDKHLNIADFKDYGPQGMQVEGKENVNRIVTGVSACVQLFDEAANLQADMVIVHHGILWDHDNHVLKGGFKQRVKTLFDNDITLLAYHLPLDKHAELGNNAIAAKMLGLKNVSEFVDVGIKGEITACTIDDLVEKTSKVYQCSPMVFKEGRREICRVAICSGAAQRHVMDAVDAGVDAYITGEVSEYVMHQAREEHIHFIAAGHYATERLGIKALGQHVADIFGVDVTFVDIPNPV